MKIKICGLFRNIDIDYANEARPDYAGFVFAESRRQVSPAEAAKLRRRLAAGIVPVGVFVNAPVVEIAALYADGVISIAQLHGGEDGAYIARLKDETAKSCGKPVPVIQAIKSEELKNGLRISANGDYVLIDSGAGSGKTFNWNMLGTASSGGVAGAAPAEGVVEDRGAGCNQGETSPFFLRYKPWFLAGGIGIDNIGRAIALRPFAVDVSGGAETDGVKDREKMIFLTEAARKAGDL